MRNGRILMGFVLALLVVGVVAGIAFTAYNMGVSQGVVDSGKLVLPAPDGPRLSRLLSHRTGFIDLSVLVRGTVLGSVFLGVSRRCSFSC